MPTPPLTLALLLVVAMPAAEPGILLAEAGTAHATIVIPASDLPLAGTAGVYRFAARELAEHIRLATGAELPIRIEPDVPDGTLVLVGEGDTARAAGITAADLPLEGFRVSSWARGLAIVGRAPGASEAWARENGQRGTLNGVYDLLERHAGVRWYWPGDDGRSVPTLPALRIPSGSRSEAPAKAKRTYYTWAAKHWPGPRPDFELTRFRFREGVSTPVTTACHTPTNFGVHLADRPACFQLRLDGSRDPEMPCYGNPETVEQMLADLEAFYALGDKRPWMRADGKVWFPPTATTIHISPPDAAIDCACAHCRPLLDPAAGPLGRASRLMARFVEAMARGIAQRWPDKQVFYLPYHNYTLPVPGIRLPGNVTAGICLMHGAGNAKEPAIAAAHDAMIVGWAATTGKPVHLWEYPCWPGDDTALPFQYPHVLRDFQRRHRDDVVGSFLNGNPGPPDLAGGHWAFQHWTLYCWFRLMWNPDFDVDAALAEFLARMYGPAQEPMDGIYRSLITRWEDSRWSVLPRVHQVAPQQIHEETLPRAEALRLRTLLADARAAAAEGTVERRRIEFVAPALEAFFAESDRYHEGAGLPELGVLKVGADPAIDGVLDEPCWRDAARQAFRTAFVGQPAPSPGRDGTWVQAVWTPRAVTLAFTCEVPPGRELSTAVKMRNQNGIWWDDCVEMFVDAAATRTAYRQIIVNAAGTLWYGERDLPGLQAAVRREPGRWTAEVRLPLAALAGVPGLVAPQVGKVWYGNFAVNRPAAGKPSYQRWSSAGRDNHSDFSAFGRLRFVE